MSPRAAAALGAAALLGACAQPPAPPPAAATPVGETWMLETLAGAAPSSPVTLRFSGDRIEGAAQCNTYFGGARLSGAAASLGPIVSTRRACPALAEEQAFLGGLTDAAGWRREGDRLTLTDAGGGALMTFAAAR